MYVCKHACMYVCIHVRLYGWWSSENASVSGRVVLCFIRVYIMYVCLHVCMYACLSVCMSVHMVKHRERERAEWTRDLILYFFMYVCYVCLCV